MPTVSPSDTYPHDIANVQEGLATLSLKECLVTLDEAMSRRGPNHKDLEFQVAVNRRARAAWNDARDQREAAKEEAEDVA